MKMKFFLLICVLPTILSLPLNDLDIYSSQDCWKNENNTITRKYAVLVNFSPKFNNGTGSCSVQIANPWASEMQNGFGIFISQRLDCSSTMTIECLPDTTSSKQISASSVQYTCHGSSREIEMPCRLIQLTFKRDTNNPEAQQGANVQVVALAKEPCMDRDLLFQCPADYPHSCIDRSLQCNGRSECPSGADERGCNYSSSNGTPIIVIVLLVLAFLFLICILSTILICCCCRAACTAIIHRFHPGKKEKFMRKGETAAVVGEDAGLMRDLTGTNVITVLPQKPKQPTTLLIDSTKPVYPRLE